MAFPLKPFLFLCINSPNTMEQSAFTDYNEGVKLLAQNLGPITFDPVSIPNSSRPIPRELENWTCRELSIILKVPDNIIFWTIIELQSEGKIR